MVAAAIPMPMPTKQIRVAMNVLRILNQLESIERDRRTKLGQIQIRAMMLSGQKSQPKKMCVSESSRV